MSLLTSIVAYWKLDENTGTSAADATGNSNTGTLSGSTIPTWTTGKINSGLSFNGTTAYVSLPNNADLNLSGSDITMSAWVNTSSPGNSNQIIGGYQNSGSFFGYGFMVGFPVNGKLGYWQGSGWVGSNTALNNGAWRFVAVSVTGGVASFYLDGAADGTPASTAPSSFSGLRAIGSVSDGTGNFFAGLIDEVAIWSRALTSTEVSQLYNSGAGLQYPFGGGATSSLFRQNNLTGIGSGGPFFQNPLTCSMLGWRKKLSGLLIPDPVFA